VAPASPIRFRRRLRYLLEFVAARVLFCLLQIMPLEWAPRLATGASRLAWDVLKVRRRTTMDNLRHVFPDYPESRREQIARDMWAHLVIMICEIAHAPRKIHETNWRDFIRIRDRKLMSEYFLDWRPCVLVSGHLGNFELAVFVTGILAIPTSAVARPLDNPWLDRWIHRLRRCHGQSILPSSGSAVEIGKVLDDRGVLLLLGDQHAGQKGCWVDFMGRPASCHKAVALFTLSGQAPMLVSYTVRRGAPLKYEIGCSGVADPVSLGAEQRDVRALTQWYNRQLEALIRRDPEQYWWMHNRWKEQPARRGRSARIQQHPPRAA
jgi:KDO2-lipid IV(A) lauroyltransferase